MKSLSISIQSVVVFIIVGVVEWLGCKTHRARKAGGFVERAMLKGVPNGRIVPGWLTAYF
jgi:hypothetical protein